MSKINKLLIAGAGTGKTTFLVKEALKIKSEVLITTFTEANEQEIRKKFIVQNGFIPNNITIKTWFSMLIQHGVKPYQSYLFNGKINGMILVNQQSSQYISESNIEQYYFTKDYKIYSDKLSKFVIKCNEKSKNAVFYRLSKIYSCIFIDEVQDLAGYDLEIIKNLFQTNSNIILVGDPRQTTYKTHNERLNKKYNDGKIKEYLKDKCKSINYEIDEKTLNYSYRSNKYICKFSSKIYTEYEELKSNQNDTKEHAGIFFIKKNDVNKYLEIYKPIQLRDTRKTKVNEKYKVINIGESKGLGFDRVLLYPTKPFMAWILDSTKELKSTSKSKLYVAITRAKYSVGIIYDYGEKDDIEYINKWRN